MADTVTTQTISDTSGVKFVAKLTNFSDGTGETLVTKVDASATTFMTEDGNRLISKVYYSINTSDSKSGVELIWDGATNATAIQFQQAIVDSQKQAKNYIEEVLENNGVKGEGTYINAVDLPEDLDKHRQELEDLKQEQIKAKEESKAIEAKRKTELRNKQLVQTKKAKHIKTWFKQRKQIQTSCSKNAKIQKPCTKTQNNTTEEQLYTNKTTKQQKN